MQKSIARFLDRKTAAIDTLIAKKQRLIQLLEEKRTALINQAVIKGLNPNAPMKDSCIPWIGKIPEHWEVKRLKQVTSRLAGRLVVQPHLYFSDNGVPIVFGFNISRGHIDTDNLKYMSFEADQRFARCRVSAGDLLTVRVGDPGVTAVVPEKLAGCHFASTMLIKKSSKFYSDWLCFCMNSEVIQSQIDMVNYGAAQKQFNIGDAVNFQIPFPPFEEQFLIAEKLVLILSKVDKTRKLQEKQIEKLQEYRRSLITAAVTGKLHINNLNQET